MKSLPVGIALIGLFAAGLFAGKYFSPATHVESSHSAERPRITFPKTVFPLSPEDAGSDRESPALAVNSNGTALLAWVTQNKPGLYSLLLAISTDGGSSFSEPRLFREIPVKKHIAKFGGKEREMANLVLPRLVAAGNHFYLAWVEPRQEGNSLCLSVCRSSDGGNSFFPAVQAHSEAARKPSYTALGANEEGKVLLAWLDNRGGGQCLYASTIDFSTPAPGKEFLVEEGESKRGICPCCDVEAFVTPVGKMFLAYRHQENGNRDVYVRQVDKDGKPGEPVCVTKDHWKFDGCPHDGPSLSLAGNQLLVSWMDAHTGFRKSYVATTPSDGTLSFQTKPLPLLNTIGEQGQVKLRTNGSGTIGVWEESLGVGEKAVGHQHGKTGSGRVVLVSQWDLKRGEMLPPLAVDPQPGRFQTRPTALFIEPGTILVSYFEEAEKGKSLVVVKVEYQKKVEVINASPATVQ